MIGELVTALKLDELGGAFLGHIEKQTQPFIFRQLCTLRYQVGFTGVQPRLDRFAAGIVIAGHMQTAADTVENIGLAHRLSHSSSLPSSSSQ